MVKAVEEEGAMIKEDWQGLRCENPKPGNEDCYFMRK